MVEADLGSNESATPRKRRHGAGPGLSSTEAATRKTVACHFSKHPALKPLHPNCRGFILRGIADLKLHFKRCHKQPPFCDICKRVFHGDTGHKDRDDHLSAEPGCEQNSLPEPQGITPAVWNNLVREKFKRPSSQTGSKEMMLQQNWHRVWDIIFPGIEHPDAIFHECTESDEWLHNNIESYLRSETLRNLVEEQAQTLGIAMPNLTRFSNHLLGSFREYPRLLAARTPEHPAPSPAPGGANRAGGVSGTGGTGQNQPEFLTNGPHRDALALSFHPTATAHHLMSPHLQPELPVVLTRNPAIPTMFNPYSPAISQHHGGRQQDPRRHQPASNAPGHFPNFTYSMPLAYMEHPVYEPGRIPLAGPARGPTAGTRQAQLLSINAIDPQLMSPGEPTDWDEWLQE
ncbi:hypothetical protein QBC43DRAFT_297779 [Cladorrhinum sp. PSN259]|nr:hypothetical protein QBC43DRAFT_297779 [Cladorrhinum sp. PSN259]